MNIKHTLTLAWLSLCFTACASGGNGEIADVPDTPPPASEKKEISIDSYVTAITKATDAGFENNDKIGLYVVNLEGNATLKTTGNHVDNMRFTLNGTWTPDTPVYWEDDNTHADFYLYYPYKPNISDVRAVEVAVMSDQSTAEGYKASEVLAGATRDVAPTESSVKISAKHMMSQIVIEVKAGEGFKEDELKETEMKVAVNGVKTAATLDIAEAKLTAKGEATTVVPLLADNCYKALIVPQTVEECDLITVTIDGRDFNMKKAFTFEAGKSHSFTVTVNKTSNGINVNIPGWETDDTDNGGVAE
ncbi:MAG: fimbrillin family protein [Prevotella sp.]